MTRCATTTCSVRKFSRSSRAPRRTRFTLDQVNNWVYAQVFLTPKGRSVAGIRPAGCLLRHRPEWRAGPATGHFLQIFDTFAVSGLKQEQVESGPTGSTAHHDAAFRRDFLAAILLPSLMLAWLASALDQEIVQQHQQAIICGTSPTVSPKSVRTDEVDIIRSNLSRSLRTSCPRARRRKRRSAV